MSYMAITHKIVKKSSMLLYFRYDISSASFSLLTIKKIVALQYGECSYC